MLLLCRPPRPAASWLLLLLLLPPPPLPPPLLPPLLLLLCVLLRFSSDNTHGPFQAPARFQDLYKIQASWYQHAVTLTYHIHDRLQKRLIDNGLSVRLQSESDRFVANGQAA